MGRLNGKVCVLFRTRLMNDASYFSSYKWPYCFYFYFFKFSSLNPTKPEIKRMFMTVNKYQRNQLSMKKPKLIYVN